MSGEGRLGGDQVEGRRAVTELLRAGRRRVKTVFVSSAARHDPAVEEIIDLAAGAARVVGPDEIERRARSETHQGVVALAAPLRPADLDDLAATDDAFLVVLDGVTDPRNLGSMLRSGEGAGVTGVVLARHRSAHLPRDQHGDALGSLVDTVGARRPGIRTPVVDRAGASTSRAPRPRPSSPPGRRRIPRSPGSR